MHPSVPRFVPPYAPACVLLAGLLVVMGAAPACEHYTAYPDVVLDSVYLSAPVAPHVFMAQERGRSALRKCSFPGGPIAVLVRLDVPGLVYAGELHHEGRTYASYASSPDSALFAFDVYSNVFERKPLRLGEERVMEYQTSAGDGLQHTINYTALVFSRGGRMRTSSARTGQISLRSPGYPGLDSSASYYLAPRFPAVTCPLQDVSEVLPNVQLAELPVPGSTAKEKPLAVRMNCGSDAPRAQITLTDAGDATNSGSQLTPTVDSDAKGVRVQLLQAGSEVAFGRIWDFEPGVGGTHEIAFTARYIRTNEPLVPGLIKGEALLNVDYW
ncbi:fimbrial protein [Stenotrophomonas maltophilia]|uniref:fimbrial protein n=1 Tax=Stenotrophomonas maltophilia TaxID=40324 RepID=UPI001F3B1AD2|nr:fimbrial protein [Stenotrophomonas maltophilia]